MKLIFLGPPGAGKGTLAALTTNAYGIPQISTGDLFREAVKNETELGLKVKSIMAKGELVPDLLTVDLVRERLGRADAKKGYILDGFPRTIPQAEALDRVEQVNAVINFQIDDDTVVGRLSGRRVCRACGAIFHVKNMPPKVEGKCDKCSGDLYIRDDDQIEAIRNRLAVYKKQTEPLISYYRKKGLLKDIDASVTPEQSVAKIRELLG
jgi:adenylate kinase